MMWMYFLLVFVPVRSDYANSTTGAPGNLYSTPCIDKNHLFLAPGVLTAGGTNRACISRFYPDGPARLLLSLEGEDMQRVTALRELPPGDGGCIDISVPLLPNTKADLVVNVWYPEVKCSWEKRMTLRISSGRVVVVHAERARYRPGETLRARVFTLKPDLTPAHGNIEEIWLEGPPGAWEGSRITQWTKVRSRLGLAQVQYDIDELAPPGRWTVRARLGDGSQGSAAFWVGNYELPPFQLSVRHAPRVLRTSERLVWTVCVRYPWTEAVEGMLVIRLRGAGSDSGGVRTAVRLRAPRACHRHAAAARRVGLGGEHPPDVVVADFSFQEEGTRVWQNTTVVSQVVDKPIFLEFLTKHRTVITPGLPYKLKVKATRWDDKPASDERIRVCRYASNSDRALEADAPTCVSGATDATGIARAMFAASDDANQFYRFEASLANDSTITTGPLTLATRRSSIQAALGPLRADSKGTRTFVPLYLSLQNASTPVTVHFVVITRGGIIYRWGATTQCPIASSSSHVQTAPRNSRCDDSLPQYDDNTNQYDRNGENRNPYDENRTRFKRNQNQYGRNGEQIRNNANIDRNLKDNSAYARYRTLFSRNGPYRSQLEKIIASVNNTNKETTKVQQAKNTNNDNINQNDYNNIQNNTNASDALLDRHLLRVMLPIKVTQQMCPDSHLIAYFYYNGEFVSASKHFEMDDCFVNKVEATWLSRQTLPGSQATLQVSTPGPALCALTALDSAAKWTSPHTVKEVIISGLRKMIDGHRNVTEYDAGGNCFLTMETPELPTNSLELTAAWLAAAGVRIAGELTPSDNCVAPAPLTDEVTVPRSDFSEAWLWRLVTVGANGSALTTAKAPDSITRFEANAVCLSKNGVAVSPPAVLQVFREFFIHADCPRRLRRGDSTIVRYRLFNYLYEPLSVQIQILTDPQLQGPSDLVESVCIPPRASAARRAALQARGAGDGRVMIRAKAVSDGGCGNGTARRGVSDEVIIKITVDPEGLPIQEHKSMLICGDEGPESNKSKVIWSWSPASAVPGTESLIVWATGNIVGPLLADADALVQLPRGCGEQNMARLATNLLALTQLHPHCAAALAAREHVAKGFTRQLQYVHPSGGFSAFGASDATSSTWLTAFSLRYLRRAHKMLWPNLPIPATIEKAEQWLMKQQMENGCFRNEGQVFHRELRGGLNEEGEIASVAITAYVITSLIESTSPLPSRIIRNTLACLRALPPLKYKTPTRIYGHALLAYSFMRLKKYEEDLKNMNEASWLVKENLKVDTEGLKENEGMLEVMELLKMARREGDYLWWETSSLATSIEATGYALLALRESPAALREFGAGAVRWLASHRGASGGFVSTQDTLVALEALSAWSSLQPAPANLTVTAKSGTVSETVTLHPEDNTPDVMKMGTGDKLTLNVQGSGCALVQATRSYNTLASEVAQNNRLSVQLTVHTDGEFDCDATRENCFCAAVVEACAVWSGSFPEMALMEISLPGGYGADASKLYSQLHQPNSLLRRIELTPTSSRASLYLGARGGAGSAPRRGHACFALHAVGPRAHTRPSYVRLMDYYRPSVNDTQIYTIPEDCPARITHEPQESTQDQISDNVFNEARSLSDSGEILITHEYSFEDIPEGIPLEDPLYDNLSLRDEVNGDLMKGIGAEQVDVGEPNSIKNVSDEYYTINKILIDHASENKENKIVENTEDIKTNKTPKDKHSSVAIDDKLDIPEEENSNSSIADENQNRILAANTGEVVKSSHESNKIVKDIELSTKYPEANNNVVQFDRELLPKENSKSFEETVKETTICNEKQRSLESSTQVNIKENDQTTKDNSITTDTTKLPHRIEIRDEQEKQQVDNPKLTDFHVIDSEKDLDVPSGIEGPIPAVALPPQNYMPPQNLVPTTQNLFGQRNFEPQQQYFDPQQHMFMLQQQTFVPQHHNFVAHQNFEPQQQQTIVPQQENFDFLQQNFEPQQQKFLPRPQNFAPNEDFGWQGYSTQNVYSYRIPYYSRRSNNPYPTD